MTKRKPDVEKLKRGPKMAGDSDVGTWLAIETRRRQHGNMGAKSLYVISRELLRLTGDDLAPKTLSNRYHRVEARRRADPAFAAHLETALRLSTDRSDPPPGFPSDPTLLVLPADLKFR